jgi:hypothetical protein
VRDHGSAVDQMHSHRLCRGCSNASAGASGPTAEHPKSAMLARPLRAARTYVAPRQIPPHCPLMNPTKAQVDEATNQCVNALTRSAQLRDCFIEDDAGRAEDKRTGLSIAETELDALLPLPTKSRPPAITSPEPTQRFLAVVGSTRRALNIVCRLYLCIGVDMPVIVPEEFPARETFERFPFLVTVPLVSVEPEYWP